MVMVVIALGGYWKTRSIKPIDSKVKHLDGRIVLAMAVPGPGKPCLEPAGRYVQPLPF
jgi:hypothetical protein